MAWPTFTVDVTQNSNQIKVYGAVPASELPAGFEVIISGISNLEVSYGTAVMYDGSNNPYSHLYLVRPYTGVTATNLEMVVKPTGSQFNDVVGIFQNASNLLNSTMAGFRQFVEGASPVTFQPLDENAEPLSIDPLPKMNADVGAFIASATSEKNSILSTLATDYATKTASLTISATMGYRNAVEKASGGRETLITDAQGNDNIMCVIPRMNYEDLELPELNLGTGTMTAFLTNGAPRSEVMISKYINSGSGSNFASIGGAIPRNHINFDTAKSLCTNKGAGWHMMSQHEWEVLRLISLKFNAEMRGNTYWGRAHDARFESATRTDGRAAGDATGDGRTKTGQGPLSWSHDGTPWGVFDMVGNVWEWVDQFKIVDGQIICTLDNNPSAAEADWIAQAAFYDNAGGLKLSNSRTSTASTNTVATSITATATYVANQLMRRLGVEHATSSSTGRLYVNNDGERLPFRGGYWSDTSNAGPAALHLNSARSYSFYNRGSRSAFFA